MALGGTLALLISYFAFRDAQLSLRNVLLCHERRFIQTQGGYDSQGRVICHDLEYRLEVNFRETGTEVIDRIGMDIFMRFGAIMVGIGILMAIGGANPREYRASNCALWYAQYDVVNLCVEKSLPT